MPERDIDGASGTPEEPQAELAVVDANGENPTPAPQQRTPDYRMGSAEERAAYKAGFQAAAEEFRRSTSWRVTAPLRWLKEPKRRPGRTVTPVTTVKEVPSLLSKIAPKPTMDRHPVDLIRGAAPTDTSALEWSWRASGLDREPDTFVLYRIIGNDLYPRHKKGQAKENVRFILENELQLPGCEKRWVLNRIADPEQEGAIAELLKEHRQEWVRIPFDADEYRVIGWDTDVLPEPAFIATAMDMLKDDQAKRVVTAAHRLKNNYVMNNNGARNVALRDGRSRAKWVLPWDGNCFLTTEAWQEIRSAVTSKPWLTHFVVPMARVRDNSELTDPGFVPDPVEEPQLIFRRDARDEFNEEFCYGRRPKVELFWRLGIPGQWDRWYDDDWDLARGTLSDEAYQFDVAGWVARLFSGSAQLEKATHKSQLQRGRVRETAITTMLGTLDRKLAGLDVAGPGHALSFYDRSALDVLRDSLARGDETAAARLARQIVSDAEEALAEGAHSAVDRGGEHPSVTASESDDLIELQQFFEKTTALGLAWRIAGGDEFASAAARNLERWFVDPGTRMRPNRERPQNRIHRDSQASAPSGVIDFRNIYFLLDAARIVEDAPVLGGEITDALRVWLERYLDWLLISDQGRTERAAANNRGIYYDLQVAGIASYIGRLDDLREAAIRAQSRLRQHFRPGGFQVEEMKDAMTAHACFFNLQGWLCLVRIATRHAVLVPDWTQHPWSLLRDATLSALSHDLTNWPYRQKGPFDAERAVPLAVLACELGVLSRAEADVILGHYDAPAMKRRFSPHDGIPPYWNVGIAASG